MNELRVNIGGSNIGFKRAIEEAISVTKKSAQEIGQAESEILYKSTNQYIKLWESAVQERERIESLARKRRLSAEEVTALEVARFNEKVQADRLIKTSAAQQAAYAAISGGSVPGNMAGSAAVAAERSTMKRAKEMAENFGLQVLGTGAGIAGGGYILKKGKVAGKFSGAEDIEKSIAKAAEGVEEMGHAGHASSGMLREGAVLIREGLRGNFSRMIGSASLFIQYAGQNLLKYTGISFVADAISKIPGVSSLLKIPGMSKILPGIGTAMDVFSIGTTAREFFRMRHAQGERDESEKSLKESTSETSGSLRERVEGLHRLGKISDKDKANYLRSLKRGGFDDVSGVLNATAPLMKEGTIAEQEKELKAKQDLVKAQKDYRAAQYATGNDQEKLLKLLQDERDLRAKIAEATKNGDRAGALEASAELLLRQNEDKNLRASMRKKALPKTAGHGEEHQVDSLSKMGLFTQSGLLFSPMMDIAKQQLTSLNKIENGIRKIADKPDMWG
ncbi:MAG: hypothetical protein PHY43_14845 [Verrucomicrobiales bacterium]|nr:hypothetical protein [Verrucomicrobiales bacterium]